MVSIKGLDKARVLVALWRRSHGQGMSFLDPKAGCDLTLDDARELLKERSYFDYLWGRVLKVDLSGDEFDPRLYDRDNFQGAAAEAVAEAEAAEAEEFGQD